MRFLGEALLIHYDDMTEESIRIIKPEGYSQTVQYLRLVITIAIVVFGFQLIQQFQIIGLLQ